jgi:hypothetical protein
MVRNYTILILKEVMQAGQSADLSPDKNKVAMQ